MSKKDSLVSGKSLNFRTSTQLRHDDKHDLSQRFYHGVSEAHNIISLTLWRREIKQPKSRFVLPLPIKEDLHKAFCIFDVTNCGLIKPDDLRIALRCLGFEPKLSELNAMCAVADQQNPTRLSFSDFLYIMGRTMAMKDTENELRNAFKLFSHEKKSEVTFEELKKVNKLVGESLSDDELREMISVIDKNNNGSVSEEEFVQFCSKTVLWEWTTNKESI